MNTSPTTNAASTAAAPSTDSPRALALVAARGRLMDYLRGYGRGAPERLQALRCTTHWATSAAQMLAARQAHLLDIFDDELLGFVATGELSVPATAALVQIDLTTRESDHD